MSDFAEKMSKLTPRELQICEVLKQKPGQSKNDIALQLGISRHTVDTHFRHVYKKTGAENRYELIANIFLNSVRQS